MKCLVVCLMTIFTCLFALVAGAQVVQVPHAVKLVWEAPTTYTDGSPMVNANLRYKIWRSHIPFDMPDEVDVTLESEIAPGQTLECVVKIHANFTDEFCDDLTGQVIDYFYRITVAEEIAPDMVSPYSVPSEMVSFNPANPTGLPPGTVMQFRYEIIMGSP